MTNQNSSYPLLLSALSHEYSEANYEQLTGIVETIYGPGTSPEDVENIFDDIGRGLRSAARSVGSFAQQAAPIVGRAVPNMIQGAATGMSVGGPWGALIGGVAGGASGIMQQSNDPTVRGIGNIMHQTGSMVGSIRGGGLGGGRNALGAIASGGQGGSAGSNTLINAIFGGGQTGQAGTVSQTPAATGGAANGLTGLLTRPETLQALLSANMGAFGNRNLEIGGQQVPVHSILAALSTLAGRAASEAAELTENAEATPVYAENAAETLGLNPESAEGRADALLTLLALTPSIWAANRPAGPPMTVNVNQPEPLTSWAVQPAITPAPSPWPAEADETWSEWPDFEWFEGEMQEDNYA